VEYTMAENKIVICELLCFLRNKSGAVSLEKLLAIASNFFSWEDIVKAKNIVMSDI
jgi:hypothetical protein